ncbi:hypothetical protein AAG570_009792 [Ranatra chinensis]|uniref:heparosan-N-sulfate-glucuronate 5-epimerase n=1 Tax=Ranatra chinensis TaxID=642074 RepID=A0ABD0Z328_9HEMI
MRVNLKVAILCVCVGLTLITVSVWTRCGGELSPFSRRHTKQQPIHGDEGERGGSEGTGLEEIDCQINGDYSIPCRREGDEVYLPFSFIHKYFEVYGKLASYDGYERFEWSHSYSKVYYPKGKYDPRGVFLYFENYNVELRERVKCISAAEGVPVSIQWQVQGYYYPTQIAQFGLAHYSKNLTEPEPRSRVLEDGSGVTSDWQGRILRQDGRLVFNTSDGSQILLKSDYVLDFIMSVDLMLRPGDNSSMTFVLQNREKKEIWFLHYVCSSVHIYAKDHDIYHGMNCEDGVWASLTRDLIVDLQKGLSFQEIPKRKLSRSKFKIASILLEGSGWLDNLTLSSSQHLPQFFAAARWFVKHQDPDTGGWPISVKRRGTQGMKDLQPGWLSAMGQGHGISVLSRAYYLSGDSTYLEAALKALGPFHVDSRRTGAGVTAHFLGHLPWYEEYPTQPPSFVLNGFVYSLIGLYDLLTLGPPARDASMLFHQGMASLKKLLLLFDTGSGSNYDLRHFSIGCAPNIARWDYHATHVNQLLLLATIDPDPILSNTAHRWARYMMGKRAPHN